MMRELFCKIFSAKTLFVIFFFFFFQLHWTIEQCLGVVRETENLKRNMNSNFNLSLKMSRFGFPDITKLAKSAPYINICNMHAYVMDSIDWKEGRRCYIQRTLSLFVFSCLAVEQATYSLYYRKMGKSRFSIVSIVISVSNVTSWT